MPVRWFGPLAVVISLVLASCGLALDDEVGVANTTLPPPLPLTPQPGTGTTATTLPGQNPNPTQASGLPTTTLPGALPDPATTEPEGTTTIPPRPSGWCTTLHEVLAVPQSGSRLEQMRGRAEGFERAMSEIVAQAEADLRVLAESILGTIRTQAGDLGEGSTADDYQTAIDEVVALRQPELTSLINLAATYCGEGGMTGSVEFEIVP